MGDKPSFTGNTAELFVRVRLDRERERKGA
jgi:hypothetical protein